MDRHIFSTEAGKKNYYSFRGIRDNKFVEVEVQEEIRFGLDIETPKAWTVKVTHTGAYGQIKFLFQDEEWSCDNPLLGVVDTREIRQVIALNSSKTRALDIKNLRFNRSDMAELHNKYYTCRVKDTYWVELPDPNEATRKVVGNIRKEDINRVIARGILKEDPNFLEE